MTVVCGYGGTVGDSAQSGMRRCCGAGGRCAGFLLTLSVVRCAQHLAQAVAIRALRARYASPTPSSLLLHHRREAAATSARALGLCLAVSAASQAGHV